MKLSIVPLVGLLLVSLPAQDTQDPKAVFEQFQESMKGMKRPSSQAEAAEYQKKMRDIAQAALKENAQVLNSGAGLHYRGQLQSAAQMPKDAMASFLAHAEAEADAPLAHESLLHAAALANSQRDEKRAKELLARIDGDKLEGPAKRRFDSLQKQVRAGEIREGLTGNPAPDFTATHVLNGGDSFKLSDQKGKVVVVDFFATWCPPCRAVIPEMVELQKEHGDEGLQVVSVTRFYGNGMDFSADSKLPHGGKSVRDLSHEQELEVNRNFVEAFDLNYPLVFADENLGGDQYGVQGIPTVYVIGRDGNVIGHIVGSGEANHKKLVEMVKKGLADNGKAGN